MRHLMILRHAKSSWADETMRDHERPLNRRGRQAAGAMGRFMADEGLLPDLIISSDSARTRETVALWSEGARWNGPVEFEAELYHAAAETLLETARSASEAFDRIMLVAHNPGIAEFVSRASGRLTDMPTATLAAFELTSPSWNRASLEAMNLVVHQRPRELSE